MNDSATIALSTETQTSKPPAKRGRKSETPAQRLARLQHAVVEAKQAAKDAERRMFATVGEALLAEAGADSALKARVVEILRRRVTAASAKADIAALLSA